MKALLLSSAALALMLTTHARAEIAVSGNDNKRALVNGVNSVVPGRPSDTLSIIELSGQQPRLLHEVDVPHSVLGPPNSVAVGPGGRYALVSSAEKYDPADPSKGVADNRVSVVDLRANPPRVSQTLEVGAAPSGLAINKAGTLALVCNRSAGTISVLRLTPEGQATVVDTVTIGPASTGVSAVAFTPDGRHALVTRDADSIVSVLQVEGEKVTKLDRDITAGFRQYGISVSPQGGWAIVANVGRSAGNTGDVDTVSLIDLSREPFRTIDTISVGTTPEGVMASPDNEHAVVVLHNGTGRPPGHPLRGQAQVKLLRVENGKLRVVAEAPAGDWVQGITFSQDGKTVLIGNMADRTIGVYKIDGDKLTDTNQRIQVNGGPAAMATAPN